MFSLWGHTYQFNNDNNWDIVDQFVTTYNDANQNIWNPGVSEYVKYVYATRLLVKTADKLVNPSDVDLSITVASKQRILPAHSQFDGEKITASGYTKTATGCDFAFSADLTDSTNDGVAIAAAYSDGRMIGAKNVTLTAGSAKMYEDYITASGDFDEVKVFAFTDEESLIPVFTAKLCDGAPSLYKLCK